MKRRLLSDNPNEILRVICQRLRLDYDYYVRKQHKIHPQFPSFRSIAYVINRLGIDACLIKTDVEELKQLPKPVLIEYDGLFLLLDNVTNAEISIVNVHNEVDKQPIEFLNHFWSGTAMVFDTERRAATYGVTNKFRMLFNRLMFFVAAIGIISACGYAIFRQADQFHFLNYGYLLTGVVGVIIGVLFQIQEFDRSNPFINRICHSQQMHGKRDCSSILESKDARFMKWFSWSDFGLLYFVFLLSLTTFLSPNDALYVQILFSVAAAGYIPYSIYYQWRIAHKWCALCLLMQVVLFINLCLSFLAFYYVPSITDINWIRLISFSLLGGVVATALFTTLKSVLKQFVNYKKGAQNFTSLKYDNAIKSLILSSQQKIDASGLDKIVLNADGETTLTIVFNTVCNPCINKMRQVMVMFCRKQTLRIEFIFLLDHSDIASVRIARHLLTIYRQTPDEFISAFTDYISHFPGSIDSFGKNNEKDEQTGKECSRIITEQDVWCKKNNITSTPQMFLDGYYLPNIYTIEDIDYMYE